MKAREYGPCKKMVIEIIKLDHFYVLPKNPRISPISLPEPIVRDFGDKMSFES